MKQYNSVILTSLWFWVVSPSAIVLNTSCNVRRSCTLYLANKTRSSIAYIKHQTILTQLFIYVQHVMHSKKKKKGLLSFSAYYYALKQKGHSALAMDGWEGGERRDARRERRVFCLKNACTFKRPLLAFSLSCVSLSLVLIYGLSVARVRMHAVDSSSLRMEKMYCQNPVQIRITCAKPDL